MEGARTLAALDERGLAVQAKGQLEVFVESSAAGGEQVLGLAVGVIADREKRRASVDRTADSGDAPAQRLLVCSSRQVLQVLPCLGPAELLAVDAPSQLDCRRGADWVRHLKPCLSVN